MESSQLSAAGKAATLAVVAGSPPSALPFKVEPQAAPPGALDAEQSRLVEELKAAIVAVHASWTPGQQAEADAHMDDFTLCRFCTSRPDSIADALEMFVEAMLWRYKITLLNLACCGQGNTIDVCFNNGAILLPTLGYAFHHCIPAKTRPATPPARGVGGSDGGWAAEV